jgi:hypothetical protein
VLGAKEKRTFAEIGPQGRLTARNWKFGHTVLAHRDRHFYISELLLDLWCIPSLFYRLDANLRTIALVMALFYAKLQYFKSLPLKFGPHVILSRNN